MCERENNGKYAITFYNDVYEFCDLKSRILYGVARVKEMLKICNIVPIFYTLNDIRIMTGAKSIRAEYEMCYGYDKFEDFNYELVVDSENKSIKLILSAPKDLRHYTEIRDENTV